jgi:hypothetical protein
MIVLLYNCIIELIVHGFERLSSASSFLNGHYNFQVVGVGVSGLRQSAITKIPPLVAMPFPAW